MAFKLPKTVTFPFSKPIKVLELPKSHEIIEGCDGLWDSDERTIYVCKSLSVSRKKYILYHELLHALHDCAHALDWNS